MEGNDRSRAWRACPRDRGPAGGGVAGARGTGVGALELAAVELPLPRLGTPALALGVAVGIAFAVPFQRLAGASTATAAIPWAAWAVCAAVAAPLTVLLAMELGFRVVLSGAALLYLLAAAVAPRQPMAARRAPG